MLRYVLVRAGFILVVCIGIVFFVFLGMEMALNSRSARPDRRLTVPLGRALMGASGYVQDLFLGDWGTVTIRRANYRRRVYVGDILVDAYPKSMGLLGAALFASMAIGVPLGVSAAFHRHSGWSLGVLSLTLLGISLPTFLVAALIQILEVSWYRKTGTSLIPVGGFGWDRHLIVPTIVLAARPLAHLVRVSFMVVGEILDQPYIDTARAKGLPWRHIVRVHAYPNAAIPVLTAVGVSLRFSLSSLPVVERFVGWPGLGGRLLDSIEQGQTEGVVGLALALGLTIMVVNLALDIVYRLIDPRLAPHQA